jgi:hypothetical protein
VLAGEIVLLLVPVIFTAVSVWRWRKGKPMLVQPITGSQYQRLNFTVRSDRAPHPSLSNAIPLASSWSAARAEPMEIFRPRLA